MRVLVGLPFAESEPHLMHQPAGLLLHTSDKGGPVVYPDVQARLDPSAFSAASGRSRVRPYRAAFAALAQGHPAAHGIPVRPFLLGVGVSHPSGASADSLLTAREGIH